MPLRKRKRQHRNRPRRYGHERPEGTLLWAQRFQVQNGSAVGVGRFATVLAGSSGPMMIVDHAADSGGGANARGHLCTEILGFDATASWRLQMILTYVQDDDAGPGLLFTMDPAGPGAGPGFEIKDVGSGVFAIQMQFLGGDTQDEATPVITGRRFDLTITKRGNVITWTMDGATASQHTAAADAFDTWDNKFRFTHEANEPDTLASKFLWHEVNLWQL